MDGQEDRQWARPAWKSLPLPPVLEASSLSSLYMLMSNWVRAGGGGSLGTASGGLMRLVTKLQCLGSLSSRVALASQPLYPYGMQCVGPGVWLSPTQG